MRKAAAMRNDASDSNFSHVALVAVNRCSMYARQWVASSICYRTVLPGCKLLRTSHGLLTWEARIGRSVVERMCVQ